jgi:hypothetical protein
MITDEQKKALEEHKRAEEFARFMEYVDFDSNSIGCWGWLAKKTRGYGYFSTNSKSHRAHRWLYQLIHGPVDDSLVIRHKCDNAGCVNPLHLEIGTHKDNKRDQIERGRMPSRQGSRHPMAKLNDAEVVDIRQRASAGQPYPKIAAHMGLSPRLVGQIVRRETWRHI